MPDRPGEPLAIPGANPLAGDATLVTLDGICPVQGGGTVQRLPGDVRYWYFRARGHCWTISVGPLFEGLGGIYVEPAEWHAWGEWGIDYAAGWMEIETARALIVDALAHYLNGEPNWVAPPDLHLDEVQP